MKQLCIDYQSIGALTPRSTNPRTHSPKQIRQIAASIKRFGFTNPLLVDDSNNLIAGHGRLEAAKQLGIQQVPTLRLSDMTEADIRAYVIADNRLAENAGWNRELLGLELQYLSDLKIDFDVTVTGFDLPEIDILIEGLSIALIDNDLIPEPGPGIPTSQIGDVWLIGNHRLVCGDSTLPKPTSN